MSDESTKGINQYRLPRSQVVDDIHQLGSGFRHTPVVGSSLAVGLQSYLPVTVIRPVGRRGDVGHNRVVMQEMLSPPALSAAGRAAHENQAAGLASTGGLQMDRGITHHHSSPSTLRRTMEIHG